MNSYIWICIDCKSEVVLHDKRKDNTFDGRKCPVCGSRLFVRQKESISDDRPCPPQKQ